MIAPLDLRAARSALIAPTPEVVSPISLTLRIADLSVGLAFDDAALAARSAAEFRACQVDDRRPDVTLCITVAPSGAIWRDLSPEPRATPRANGWIDIEHRDFAAVVDPTGGRMGACLPPRILSVENALRVLLGVALARADGLLLHAASAVGRGGARVLFGRSGSGKSTAARLARGRPVLGDDLVAVRRDEQGWFVHSTPFGGLAGTRRRVPRTARLRGLYRLRQGAQLEIRPLPGPRAIAELVQSVVLPASGEAERRRAFETCATLRDEVGVGELHFPIDPRLWRWLDDTDA